MPSATAMKPVSTDLNTSNIPAKIKSSSNQNTIVKAIKDLVDKIFNFFYQVYDYMLPKNPETLKRQIWILPGAERLEIFLGRIFYPEIINSNGGKTFDRESNKMVKDVGDKLKTHAGRKLDYKFTQIRNKSINAFCFLGGKIAIHDGLVKEMDKFQFKNPERFRDLTREDKIAAVLSHEIVHASAKHVTRNLEIAFVTVIALVALKAYAIFRGTTNKVFGNYQGNAEALNAISDFAIRIFSNILMLSISKSCEYEADKKGMELMEKAGYNPKAAVYLQEFFISREVKRNPTLEKIITFFSTHPTCRDRLKENEITLKEIEKARASA